MTIRALIWCAVSTQAQVDDKESLPEQERQSRALCERNGWRIVETLLVPGHSRRYIDIHECAADMREQGINAFDRLMYHWDVRDFDILICRDASRFARTQTLHAHVVEATIDIGARIYSHTDGFIDQTNYRMWIAMAGFSAAGEVDRLVRGRRIAMDARAKKGLPTTSSVIRSHKIIRDELGRPIKVVVDESKRRLWNDLAALLLEGVGWKDIEEELYQRFGHVADDGKPYKRLYFYGIVNHPTFWGHSARYFRDQYHPNGTKTDMWVFDETEPLPEGVLMFRNTVEPVYTGELAERVKSELRRRRLVIRGKSRPQRTRRFSGLFICGECGYHLVFRFNKGYPGYGCQSRYFHNEHRPACPQNKQLPEWKIQGWLNQKLREMLEHGNPDILVGRDTNQHLSFHSQIVDVENEIASTENFTRQLIRRQAAAPDELQSLYDEEIKASSERLKMLRANLAALQRQAAHEDTGVSQRLAFEELAELTVDALWEQSDYFVNQLLHRLVGNRRFAILDGEFVGTTEAPPHHSKRKSKSQ